MKLFPEIIFLANTADIAVIYITPFFSDEEVSDEERLSNPVLVTIMVSDGQSTSGGMPCHIANE